MANTVDISVENDSDFRHTFTYVEHVPTSPGVYTDTPIDLTGASLLMMLRANVNNAEVDLKLETPDKGITITDAVGGTFDVLITKDQLERLQVGNYEQSMILIQGTEKSRVWRGTFLLENGPSR